MCSWGESFHAYLLGHHFDLITDHKPLLTLFDEHKPTSPKASARVRQWTLLLSAYEYAMKLRKWLSIAMPMHSVECH